MVHVRIEVRTASLLHILASQKRGLDTVTSVLHHYTVTAGIFIGHRCTLHVLSPVSNNFFCAKLHH